MLNYVEHFRSLGRRSLPEIGLYILVSVSILAILAGMFALGLTWDEFSRWVMLDIFTAMVFWYFAESRHAKWRNRVFLYVFSSLLLIHCGCWVAIIFRVAQWKITWFYLMIPELVVLNLVAEWTFMHQRRKL